MKMGKILAGFCILAVCYLIWSIPSLIHHNKQTDLACKDLGLEKYRYLEMSYCEDNEGNLHYIKMECKPWYWQECTAKTISVGTVKVK